MPQFQYPPEPLPTGRGGAYDYEPMHESALRALVSQGFTAAKIKAKLNWRTIPTATLNNKIGSMKKKISKEPAMKYGK